MSVLAGGTLTGWTAEVAIVLWQRILGSLGNVNEIPDPRMHEHIFEYLCDLTDMLIKVSCGSVEIPFSKGNRHQTSITCRQLVLLVVPYIIKL